jgi:hypothetical protein
VNTCAGLDISLGPSIERAPAEEVFRKIRSDLVRPVCGTLEGPAARSGLGGRFSDMTKACDLAYD